MSAASTAPTARELDEQCWCCGASAQPAVRLGNHPEVAVCVRCARWLGRRAQELEDESRSGAAVAWRNFARRLRAGVMRRGWHQRRWIGAALRWLGRRLP